MDELLGVDLGGKGSGRQRYAVAMAFYQSGELNAERLEAYRVAAASDVEPPNKTLEDCGLTIANPQFAERAIRQFIGQADLYLSGLSGSGLGAGESRLGFDLI